MSEHVVRIEVDVESAVEAFRQTREVFLDFFMVHFYHDDLCEPEADVFV